MKATDRVRLGTTDVQITRLGVGTNPLGGLHDAISPEEAIATIERCWDLGIRYFDVAPVYGYGNAERAVGEVLRHKPRDEYVLETKVGRLLLEEGPAEREDRMVLWEGEQLYKGTASLRPYFDFSYDGVMRSIEDSQRRMGIDRFDILHIHDPDLYPEEALDGAHRALSKLRSEGSIRAIGCGMNQWQMLAHFARRAEFDCFLLAGRYTLLDQSAVEELLPLCAKLGIAVIGAGVYNSGILSHPDPGSIPNVDRSAEAIPTWKDNVTYNYVPADNSVIQRAARIKAVCDRYNVPLMAAAIQFPLHHPAIPTVLMGPRSPGHVESNVEMLEFDIPSELWRELKSAGLLADSAPTGS